MSPFLSPSDMLKFHFSVPQNMILIVNGIVASVIRSAKIISYWCWMDPKVNITNGIICYTIILLL